MLSDVVAVVDVELTSRCNASCSFCPRDQTPSLGTMDDRTFAVAVDRAVEYLAALRAARAAGRPAPALVDGSLWLSFCGMGDALVHPRAVDHVAAAAAAGLRPLLNTNGALLDPQRAARLLDAGLAAVTINAGEIGDDYERVYGLPWQRTLDHVTAFVDAAGGRCPVWVVVVDHRDDPAHVERMRAFWLDRGVDLVSRMGLVNRGGALGVPDQVLAHERAGDAAQRIFAEAGVSGACGVPVAYPFIGYDGRYQLCSSDWRRQAPVGNVFDHGILEVLGTKLGHVRTREPACASCTHDPTNALARALDAGDLEAAASIIAIATATDAVVAEVEVSLPPSSRIRIPISLRS